MFGKGLSSPGEGRMFAATGTVDMHTVSMCANPQEQTRWPFIALEPLSALDLEMVGLKIATRGEIDSRIVPISVAQCFVLTFA